MCGAQREGRVKAARLPGPACEGTAGQAGRGALSTQRGGGGGVRLSRGSIPGQHTAPCSVHARPSLHSERCGLCLELYAIWGLPGVLRPKSCVLPHPELRPWAGWVQAGPVAPQIPEFWRPWAPPCTRATHSVNRTAGPGWMMPQCWAPRSAPLLLPLPAMLGYFHPKDEEAETNPQAGGE